MLSFLLCLLLELVLKGTGHKPWPRTHTRQLEAKRPAMKCGNMKITGKKPLYFLTQMTISEEWLQLCACSCPLSLVLPSEVLPSPQSGEFMLIVPPEQPQLMVTVICLTPGTSSFSNLTNDCNKKSSTMLDERQLHYLANYN